MASWGFLAASVCCGVASAVCTRICDGFTRPVPTAMLLVSQTLSLLLFALAVRKLDLSLCYGVWCGLVVVLVTATNSGAILESALHSSTRSSRAISTFFSIRIRVCSEPNSTAFLSASFCSAAIVSRISR